MYLVIYDLLDGVGWVVRYASGAGDLTFTPGDEGDPWIFGENPINMDLRMKASRGDGYLNTKVQFIPPCLVRYMFPTPPVRLLLLCLACLLSTLHHLPSLLSCTCTHAIFLHLLPTCSLRK